MTKRREAWQKRDWAATRKPATSLEGWARGRWGNGHIVQKQQEALKSDPPFGEGNGESKALHPLLVIYIPVALKNAGGGWVLAAPGFPVRSSRRSGVRTTQGIAPGVDKHGGTDAVSPR